MTTANPQPQVINTRIIRSVTAPTIYVEGVSQMVVGFPNSRLRLSSMVEHADNGESKEVVHSLACELVMPTAAMLEIAHGILQNMAQNKAAMQQAGTEWMAKVQEVFDALRPPADQKQD